MKHILKEGLLLQKILGTKTKGRGWPAGSQIREAVVIELFLKINTLPFEAWASLGLIKFGDYNQKVAKHVSL